MLVAVHLTSRSLDSVSFGRAQPIERLEEENVLNRRDILSNFYTIFDRTTRKFNYLAVMLTITHGLKR